MKARKHVVFIRISEAARQKLKELAARKNMTMGQLVDELLKLK